MHQGQDVIIHCAGTLEGAEVMHPEYGTKPHVYYKGLPKKFIEPRAKRLHDAILAARQNWDGSEERMFIHLGT